MNSVYLFYKINKAHKGFNIQALNKIILFLNLEKPHLLYIYLFLDCLLINV